jgi:hypothetical protein
MSEDTNDLIPSIIVAAIAAAGPKGSNEAAWKGKINDAIPHIASMIHDGGRQWKIAEEVLNASVFVATYVGHEVEESSTRVVVQIDTGKATKNYPDGIEPIRTHRTDNAQGRNMKRRLDTLHHGDEIVVWKALESVGGGSDGHKVRVLVHYETRPNRKDSSAGPGEGSSADGRGSPVDQSESSSSDRSGAVAESTPFTERFDRLSGPVKVACVKRFRAGNISFPQPEPEDVGPFIAIIEEEEANHA